MSPSKAGTVASGGRFENSQNKERLSGRETGKRGDPYHYGKACTLVPAPMKNIGDKKLPDVTDGGSKKKLVPTIHTYSGGQEYKKRKQS
jgi:hypothetical protein